MSTVSWIVLGLAIVMGSAVCGYFYQYKLIYFPESELTGNPADIGLEYKEVHFSAQEGISLHGWFIPAYEKDLVVLFCHGNAGNISHRMETIEVIHNLGLSVFIFDYRGFGQSQGTPSEQGTYKDIQAAWEYLVQKEQIPPEKILLWGRSLGGPIAAYMAKKKQSCGLILESTFTSIPEMAKKVYPFLPVKRVVRFNYPTRKFLPEISCPLLIIHSTEDELVPYHFGRELFDAAREPKRFLQIRGGHNEGHLVSGFDYVQGVKGFISELILDSGQ